MSDENDWLGDLPGIREIFRDGVAFIRRKALDFKGTGWTVADNPSTGRTDISIDVPTLASALAADPAVALAVAGAVSDLGIVPGTPWTPTVTGTANTGNGTNVVGWYARLGNLVIFGLGFVATDSSASAPKRLTVTVPIVRAAPFSNRRQAWGAGRAGVNNVTADPTPVGVKSIATSHLLQIDNMSTTSSTEEYNIIGAYSLTN